MRQNTQRDVMLQTDGRSKNSRYRVVPGRDDGWEVLVERTPGVVSSTYCSDWHRVERLCAALEAPRRETVARDREDRS